MTTITAHDLREGRSLVDPALFQKLTEHVATEHDHGLGMAARVVDQALAFLGTTATHQGRPLSPSEEVDPGWHEFILHTVDYAAFCEQIAGRFLHHVPTDPRTRPPRASPLTKRSSTPWTPSPRPGSTSTPTCGPPRKPLPVPSATSAALAPPGVRAIATRGIHRAA
jgi:hypothetical protein